METFEKQIAAAKTEHTHRRKHGNLNYICEEIKADNLKVQSQRSNLIFAPAPSNDDDDSLKSDDAPVP